MGRGGTSDRVGVRRAIAPDSRSRSRAPVPCRRDLLLPPPGWPPPRRRLGRTRPHCHVRSDALPGDGHSPPWWSGYVPTSRPTPGPGDLARRLQRQGAQEARQGRRPESAPPLPDRRQHQERAHPGRDDGDPAQPHQPGHGPADRRPRTWPRSHLEHRPRRTHDPEPRGRRHRIDLHPRARGRPHDRAVLHRAEVLALQALLARFGRPVDDREGRRPCRDPRRSPRPAAPPPGLHVPPPRCHGRGRPRARLAHLPRLPAGGPAGRRPARHPAQAIREHERLRTSSSC